MEKLQKTITELNDKLKKKNKTPEEQDEEFEQFYECIKDIATHPVVLRMKDVYKRQCRSRWKSRQKRWKRKVLQQLQAAEL